MSWLDKQISLYNSHRDNIGRPGTYRKILFSEFGKDFPAIFALRKLEPDDPNYQKKKVELKTKLHCYAPAALLQSRAKDNVIEIERTGIMQLDFDEKDIQDYDIEELKQAVFALPFIGFCGLSCSGKGFYALALIAEPERLKEYAEHCFEVLLRRGIKADTSKGRNVNDLRYLSYDANMLFREDPEPLRINHFKAKEAPKPIKRRYYPPQTFGGNHKMVTNGINEILTVQPGNRWQTVQKVSYTLGGLNNGNLLCEINQAIKNNPVFTGEEKKYLKCASDCFKAGTEKLLLNTN